MSPGLRCAQGPAGPDFRELMNGSLATGSQRGNGPFDPHCSPLPEVETCVPLLHRFSAGPHYSRRGI